MAVYGIGAVIALLKLAEEMERQAAQNRGQGQGLEDLLAASREVLTGQGSLPMVDDIKKKKRRKSAYSRRYSAAFKKLAPKYKKKAGGWKKNGFRRCAAAARKVAKK